VNIGRSEYLAYKKARLSYQHILEAIKWQKECEEYKQFLIDLLLFNSLTGLCCNLENERLRIRLDLIKKHYKEAKQYVYSLLENKHF